MANKGRLAGLSAMEGLYSAARDELGRLDKENLELKDMVAAAGAGAGAMQLGRSRCVWGSSPRRGAGRHRGWSDWLHGRPAHGAHSGGGGAAVKWQPVCVQVRSKGRMQRSNTVTAAFVASHPPPSPAHRQTFLLVPLPRLTRCPFPPFFRDVRILEALGIPDDTDVFVSVRGGASAGTSGRRATHTRSSSAPRARKASSGPVSPNSYGRGAFIPDMIPASADAYRSSRPTKGVTGSPMGERT